LVRELNPPRSADSYPLFQVLTVGHPGQNAHLEPRPLNGSKFDLPCGEREKFGPAGEPLGAGVEITYSFDLFDHESVIALTGRLHRIPEAAAEDAELQVSIFIATADNSTNANFFSVNHINGEMSHAGAISTVGSIIVDRLSRTLCPID
jgi:hypothetical protein